jgi:hypothetical protein
LGYCCSCPLSLYKTIGCVITNRKFIKYVLVLVLTCMEFCQLVKSYEGKTDTGVVTHILVWCPRDVFSGSQILFVDSWYVCLDGGSPLQGVSLHTLHTFIIHASSGIRTTIPVFEWQKTTEHVLNRIILTP